MDIASRFASHLAGFSPSRLGASLIMVGICILWSTAGVVSRQMESADGAEMTFWRSFACGVTLLIWGMAVQRKNPWQQVREMGHAGLLSGVFWCVMFTCFMVSVALTTVANTLLTISLSPLVAALLARLVLGIRVARVTWLCIAIAGLGMWWMFRSGLSDQGLTGILVALGVPFASAMNLVLLRSTKERVNLAPAVMVGGFLSAVIMLPFLFPMTASVSDVAWLTFLGIFQLALPCSILVWLTRFLPPQEIALLALLEIVLGSALAWVWGNEPVPVATLQGGALIVGALVFNTIRRSS